MLLASIISLFVLSVETRPATVLHVSQSPKTQRHPVQGSPSVSTFFGFDEKRCLGIAELSSSEKPVFTAYDTGEWQCTYVIDYAETGHKPSLFLQIRGVEPGVWNNFRIKLNFGSVLSRQVLAARAANIVYSLFGTNMALKDLETVLASGLDMEIAFGEASLKYRQERGDPNRYNLFGTRTTPQPQPDKAEQ
ncbi:DUF6030 family protein [Rhizobium skierniewicense]|uniref:DUF6030 family protein n=1 Tax=Rhizobium skierniewicense TaxID=984260 RepID=UPI001FAD9914|nr:DUF6030 family protein [Rhizobium skierniewicense]